MAPRPKNDSYLGGEVRADFDYARTSDPRDGCGSDNIRSTSGVAYRRADLCLKQGVCSRAIEGLQDSIGNAHKYAPTIR